MVYYECITAVSELNTKHYFHTMTGCKQVVRCCICCCTLHKALHCSSPGQRCGSPVL